MTRLNPEKTSKPCYAGSKPESETGEKSATILILALESKATHSK